jgi:hypothetical protein
MFLPSQRIRDDDDQAFHNRIGLYDDLPTPPSLACDDHEATLRDVRSVTLCPFVHLPQVHFGEATIQHSLQEVRRQLELPVPPRRPVAPRTHHPPFPPSSKASPLAAHRANDLVLQRRRASAGRSKHRLGRSQLLPTSRLSEQVLEVEVNFDREDVRETCRGSLPRLEAYLRTDGLALRRDINASFTLDHPSALSNARQMPRRSRQGRGWTLADEPSGFRRAGPAERHARLHARRGPYSGTRVCVQRRRPVRAGPVWKEGLSATEDSSHATPSTPRARRARPGRRGRRIGRRARARPGREAPGRCSRRCRAARRPPPCSGSPGSVTTWAGGRRSLTRNPPRASTSGSGPSSTTRPASRTTTRPARPMVDGRCATGTVALAAGEAHAALARGHLLHGGRRAEQPVARRPRGGAPAAPGARLTTRRAAAAAPRRPPPARRRALGRAPVAAGRRGPRGRCSRRASGRG